MPEVSHHVVSHHLEVIDKGSITAGHPAPLLFVHGGFHGAWCWDEHFLDFFAEKGYRALAVSLRGHGNSSTPTALRACSLGDYVADVASVADSLAAEPVVIGHSMGGFVVQKFLEHRDAPAGVLVASMPPNGSLGLIFRLFTRYPRLMARSLVTSKPSFMSGPEFARENFFSVDSREADITRWIALLGDESSRIGIDTLLSRPEPRVVTAPMLVLGAEQDNCVTIEELWATARAYRTEPQLFPGMAHDMMLVPGWSAVADRIHAWLDDRGL
jgi:pimeloyl-ACP methyl ester carboxylesterase